MDGREETTAPGYLHTQKGPLSLILYGSTLACFALAWILPIIPGFPGYIIPVAVGLFIGSLAPAFQHLTVEDQGHRLTIRFGPMPLFQRTVEYADIERVEVGRTPIFYGCGGIHYVRGGWFWSLWGRDCVLVDFRNGRLLRIGTDEPATLAEFLEGKIGTQIERQV